VLLRPLLGLPRERLAATLRSRRQRWLDDPSNEDPRHRRVALRQAMPRLQAVGLGGERLDAAASLFGRLRACQERAAARLLAQGVAWHPAGFVRLDSSFLAAPAPVGRLALGEIARALGGSAAAPGEASLARAFDRLGAARARGFTLGGVRFLSRRDGWLALPEARTLAEVPLAPGGQLRWGGFQVAVEPGAGEGLRLRPLAQALWPALAAMLGRAPLPGPVLWVQPAVHDAHGLLALPTLGWSREKGPKPLQLRFIPEAPLGGFGFTVACGERHII
jgi:tRNA(Ile)-lysidine synthase